MVTKYFSLRINGTDESVLNVVRDWLQPRVESADLHGVIGDGSVRVFYDDDPSNSQPLYVLVLKMFLLPSTPSNKYRDIIASKWGDFDKSSFVSAKAVLESNCTHDSDQPNSPCSPVTVWEWSSP